MARLLRECCIGTLVLTGLGALAFVLAWKFSPPEKTRIVVSTGFRNITRPMDLVIMLDASGSISPDDWKREVEFPSRLVVALAQAFADKNATLRAALGQFSTSARIDVPLTADAENAFNGFVTWTCPKGWFEGGPDNPCEGDAQEQECLDDPHCIVRRLGFTETGSAFCGGPRPTGDAGRTSETCKGGAAGELWYRAPQLPREPRTHDACNEIEATEPLQFIVLVTDGKPMTPNPKPGEEQDLPVRGTIATRDAVSAARLVENSPSETKVLGVMVGGTEGRDTLKALSSCCGWNQTLVNSIIPDQATCAHAIPDDCPYYLYENDFQTLLENVEDIFTSLARFETAQCSVIVEEHEAISPGSALWLLLLPLPLLFNIFWGWLLLCCAGTSDRTLIAEPVAEPEVVAKPSPEVEEIPDLHDAPEMPHVVALPAIPLLHVSMDQPLMQPDLENPVDPVLSKKRKYIPPRHSVIINGRPIRVNYGTSEVPLPPHAPIMARRGDETPSPQDTPETALHQVSFQEAVLAVRSAVKKSSHTDKSGADASASSADESAADDNEASVAEAKGVSPNFKSPMSPNAFVVKPEDLPRFQAYHCSFFFVVLITLALLPAISYLTFRPKWMSQLLLSA